MTELIQDNTTISTILSVVALLHILVQALRPAIAPLERWAESTPSQTDDRIVRSVAAVVRGAAKLLGAVETVLAPATKRDKR